MMGFLGFGPARLCITLLLAGAAVAGFGQSGQAPQARHRLTVPATALPAGCALTLPAAQPALNKFRSPFPTNPWSGTDRKIVAAVHRAINATPRKPLPDAPPSDAREVAASELKWAENVLEAYHATYTSAYYEQIDVYAVAFSDVKLAEAPESVPAILNPPPGFASRMILGATLARVSAPAPGECARAVDRYLRSLK